MGDSFMGVQARLMSQALRKLTGAVSRSNTALVFTNQLREKIGVMFGNPETTPGGRALKFYASVRLDIRRIETIKTGTESVGNRVRVKVVKNKVAAPFRVAEFDIMYGEGISKEGGLLDVGVAMDVVTKTGAWFTFGETRLGQGREASKEFLKANPDIAEEIDGLIRAKINDVAIPVEGIEEAVVTAEDGARSDSPGRPARAEASFAERRERRGRRSTIRRSSSRRPPRFLEAAPRSVAEVRRRLTVGSATGASSSRAPSRGCSSSAILDDEAFARAWVESRDRARPRGERAIRAGARAQGRRPRDDRPRPRGASRGGRRVASRRRATRRAGRADQAAAERLLARNARSLARVADPRQRRQRAYALLARNGFDPEVVPRRSPRQRRRSDGRRGEAARGRLSAPTRNVAARWRVG